MLTHFVFPFLQRTQAPPARSEVPRTALDMVRVCWADGVGQAKQETRRPVAVPLVMRKMLVNEDGGR